MFTAPQMWQLIEYYDNGISDVMKLDAPSQALLLKLFDAASPIAPDENGHKKRFYFYLPKGSFEYYKKLHDGTEAQLRDWYNHETDGWFDCMLIYQQLDWEDEPFYGVYINDMYVLSLHDRNEVEWPETDATEFIEGLISIVNDVVQMLKKGVYNDWVKENLAYHLRVGTISRHAYWEVYPEEKTKYALSEHEKQVLMLEKPTTTTVPKTAREFYEACAVCYRAVGLDDGGMLFTDTDEEHRRYGGVTPKEFGNVRELGAVIRSYHRRGKNSFRINHMNWWDDELPSLEQLYRFVENSEKYSDLVLTHDAPSNMCLRKPTDLLRETLNQAYDIGNYKYWCAGHHHIDKRCGNDMILYKDIVRIV